MPVTREPVTKCAETQCQAVHSTSISRLISRFEACIRADLSFSLLSAGLRYEPPALFLPQQRLLNGRLLRVKWKLYFSYARSVVVATIIDIS
jgi:hypothetical protein